jgi:hypothetical protein
VEQSQQYVGIDLARKLLTSSASNAIDRQVGPHWDGPLWGRHYPSRQSLMFRARLGALMKYEVAWISALNENSVALSRA